MFVQKIAKKFIEKSLMNNKLITKIINKVVIISNNVMKNNFNLKWSWHATNSRQTFKLIKGHKEKWWWVCHNLLFISSYRYGVVGCGQRVARAEPLRKDFAQMNGIKAFHHEHDAVLESIEGNCCESYIVILGEFFTHWRNVNLKRGHTILIEWINEWTKKLFLW